MNNVTEIVDRLLALYDLIGRGNWNTDYEKLEEGYNASVEDMNIPNNHACRIWGIMSDVYNREHYGDLGAEPMKYLENELYAYFDQVNRK